MTAAGAAILAIVIAAVTTGAGEAAGGTVTTFGGVVLSTTVGTGAAAVITYTALGTVINAAATTLTVQSLVGLANNGGDVGKTLKELGSKDSVRNLAASVVTAGLLSQVGSALNLKPESSYFPDRLIYNFTTSVGSTLVQTAIKSGNLQDNLEKALLAGLSGTLQGELAQVIGDFLDLSNSDVLEYTIHKIAHAAGCAAAAATKASCKAGVIGAGVGEIVGGLMPEPVNGDKYTVEEKLRNRNAGKIVAGVVSAYDVNTAANEADIAIENNNNTRGGPKRSLFTYLAKKAVNYIAPEKVQILK